MIGARRRPPNATGAAFMGFQAFTGFQSFAALAGDRTPDRTGEKGRGPRAREAAGASPLPCARRPGRTLANAG